jgi:hypothetical protein
MKSPRDGLSVEKKDEDEIEIPEGWPIGRNK